MTPGPRLRLGKTPAFTAVSASFSMVSMPERDAPVYIAIFRRSREFWRYAGKTMPYKRLAVAAGIALILIAYASTLRTMVQIWMTDEDLAQGILVPPVILWILYRERARLKALPVEPSRWGWLALTMGAALQFASVRGAGIFVGSVAFVVSLVGAVLCLGGIAWTRALAFPLLLTCFMLPKLTFLYDAVTLPLQLLASRLAAGILTAAGFAVIRTGNILSVSGHLVSVEAACNGIRYLLPLGFVALFFAYLL